MNCAQFIHSVRHHQIFNYTSTSALLPKSRNMPTVAPPRQQAPMEAIADIQNAAPAGAPAKLITKQPKSEPQPDYENEVSMRGGGMNLGFTCCNGACSFHKRCC